jgi:2-oxoglutarate ferredoxin oxidoreductase subunit alpha
VNIMRAGPGLGGILPSQADYFQATKGGGHGDYRLLVLAPWSVQEAADLVQDGFDLADHYRNPVMILGDGLIGQMMEPVEFHEDRKPIKELKEKTWAATGYDGSRPRAIINSLFLDPATLEKHNHKLQAKYAEMVRDEIRYEEYGTEKEYDILIVAYGTVARVCSTAMEDLAEEGVRTAMIRPVSLFPFPYEAVRKAAEKADAVLVVELSAGQMLEDIRLALMGARPIHFHNRMGGMLASPEEVVEKIREIRSGESEEVSHV